MIIKGSSRGGSDADVNKLARHLLAKENETAVVLEMRAVAAQDVAGALLEMRSVTLGTRSRRALYHASLSLPAEEAFSLDNPLWMEAADTLEQHLGLNGHQRVVVGHQKKGRRHIHVIWCRANPVTLRITSDSHNYRKHEAASRELESRWHSCPVIGVHSREANMPRPVAVATHQDWQAETRTGIHVSDVSAILKRAWFTTTTARAFRAACEANSLILAQGHRGIVVVDSAGTPHSLPRRLGVKANEVHRRLSVIPPMTLPTVEQVQAHILRHEKETTMHQKEQQYSIGSGRRRRQSNKSAAPHPDLPPEYWTALGYVVDVHPGWLAVKLSSTTTLIDAGDRITIHRVGEPTDEEILTMILSGRQRGWQSIRFFGGSEDYQRRARVIALKNGYTLDQISLECDENKPRQPVIEAPMPEHIRKRIVAPTGPDAVIPLPTPAPAPTPAQEFQS